MFVLLLSGKIKSSQDCQRFLDFPIRVFGSSLFSQDFHIPCSRLHLQFPDLASDASQLNIYRLTNPVINRASFVIAACPQSLFRGGFPTSWNDRLCDLTYELLSIPSLPLNCARRLGCDVIYNPVNTLDFVYNPV